MSVIIAKVLICLAIFCIGLLVGIMIFRKITKNEVKKAMWRICEVCKYKHLKEVEHDSKD